MQTLVIYNPQPWTSWLEDMARTMYLTLKEMVIQRKWERFYDVQWVTEPRVLAEHVVRAADSALARRRAEFLVSVTSASARPVVPPTETVAHAAQAESQSVDDEFTDDWSKQKYILGLAGTGKSCYLEKVSGCFEPENTNDEWLFLLYGAHNAGYPFPFGAHSYIVVNYEQCTSGWAILENKNYLAVMTRARAVWDYSPRNVAFFRNLLPATTPIHLVPFGYHPCLKLYRSSIHRRPTSTSIENDDDDHKDAVGRVLETKETAETAAAPTEERPVDVLFYGTTHARRTALLKSIREVGVGVEELMSETTASLLFGCDLWKRIRKAKVVVNIHYYPDSILEVSRILPAVANGALVISEASSDPAMDSMYQQICVIVPPKENFAVICKRFCSDEGLRKATARAHFVALTTLLQQSTLFAGSPACSFLFHHVPSKPTALRVEDDTERSD